MGYAIALGVLICLAILPLGVSAMYNAQGPNVFLLIGPVRVRVYPKKPKAEKPEKSQTSTKQKNASSQENQGEQGGSLKDFFPLVDLILDFLGNFRKKLRVDRLEMKLILAGDDPCDLAVNYGRAWAALGNLMPQLERFFVIKKRNLEVACDFAGDKSQISARLDLTITVARLLSLGAVHGFRLLREYLKIVKLRKGGAKT